MNISPPCCGRHSAQTRRPAALRLVQAGVLTLLAPLVFLGCKEDECERLSDCNAGFVCIDGACVRGSDRGAGSPPDIFDIGPQDDPRRRSDGGTPLDAGVDMDAGPMDGAGMNPDLGGPLDGGMEEVLPNRLEVFVRELSTGPTRILETGAFLQDLSNVTFSVRRETFNFDRNSCELVVRQQLSGSVGPFFSAGIRLSARGGPMVVYELQDPDRDGQFSATMSPVAPFLLPRSAVQFTMTASPQGSPRPAFGALGAQELPELNTPEDIANLTPSPAFGVDLEVQNTFIWNPAVGSPADPSNQIRFEAVTLPNEDVRLACVFDDLGQVRLPPEPGQAFESAAGRRNSVLRVLRQRSIRWSVIRLNGQREPVTFRIEVGAQFPVR